MNSYEAKLEARRERLEARARNLRREGEARLGRANRMADVIPFGQPILVGHHSEGRDRRYREKIRNNFSKGYEAIKAAGELSARAASVGSGGISSDDPEAVAKLKEELVPLKAKQERMKAANAIKKLKGHLACAEAYLVDGAPHSALCHVVAAQCVMKGEPVPKGPDFWNLAGNAQSGT